MSGYVDLQLAPYRAHRLLVDTVMRHAPEGGRVLDGGASSGYLAQILTSRGLMVDGVEIDPGAAQSARRFCRHVAVGDLQTLDPDVLDGPYDVMLFGDTLEHLPDPARVLRRFRPKLKADGVLVATVPNVANWAVRLGLLFGRFEYRDRGIMDRTHLRFFTKRGFSRMLRDGGFRVLELRATVPVPGVTWAPLCALAHRVGNLWPSLLAYQFLVTATQEADPVEDLPPH